MTIVVEGLDEVQAYLKGLRQRAKDHTRVLVGLAMNLQRFAHSISPVVTGSYASSHRATITEKMVEISIDPSARNTVSRVLVTSYAGPVEDRHRVYARIGDEATRLLPGVVEEIVKEIIG